MNISYYSQDMIMNIGMIVFFVVFAMLMAILIIFIKSLFMKEPKKRFEPKISVLIPMYNEEKNIKRCLQAILGSDYDMKKLEILCIDDGSGDRTRDIVWGFMKKHRNIRLIKKRHEGKSASMNKAVRMAKNDFILSIDSDTVIDGKFIKEIIRPFQDEKVGATNGMALIHKPRRIIEHFQAVEYYFNNLIRNSFSKVFRNGIWFFGAAACFRKEALIKSGMFNPKVLTEDMDISLKIFEKRFDVITVSRAYYNTIACKNLKELFSQRMRWFFGGLQCTFKHKKLFLRKKFSIKYVFFNQIFWCLFSIIVIPLIIYQVYFWMPGTAMEIINYLVRWFSFAGPVYVIYKIPDWGLNFINIFGVMSGFITTILLLSAIKVFKGRYTLQKIAVIFFYFPYTLVLNLILTAAIFRYGFSRHRYFKK